jgi:hypothetical protein
VAISQLASVRSGGDALGGVGVVPVLGWRAMNVKPWNVTRSPVLYELVAFQASTTGPTCTVAAQLENAPLATSPKPVAMKSAHRLREPIHDRVTKR